MTACVEMAYLQERSVAWRSMNACFCKTAAFSCDWIDVRCGFIFVPLNSYHDCI